MGGQACVFYGAAEFSRDTDLAIPSTPENLERFRAALADLEAECIALPPFEADYLRNRSHPTPEQLTFWLRELRTPVLLVELAARYAGLARAAARGRPLLASAATESPTGVENALAAEEAAEREVDRMYWQPLRAELQALRHRRP
jgi:hypothetical protein